MARGEEMAGNNRMPGVSEATESVVPSSRSPLLPLVNFNKGLKFSSLRASAVLLVFVCPEYQSLPPTLYSLIDWKEEALLHIKLS